MTGGRVVAVVGPTASGKSELAVELAERLGGEIVNADAMQLYAGMDIGTAKPSAEDRARVPHHLLDVWTIDVRAAVAEYQRLAVAAVAAIHARGRVAVVVGGSGLYVRALLEPIVIPPTDTEVRATLEADLERDGAAALHARLAALDADAAGAILPSNGRRIVRALEVVALTGSFRAKLPDPAYRWPDTTQFGLDCADLDARIDARVEAMFAAGLVEEVAALEARGLRATPTAGRALGYAQVLADPDPARASEATARATRRFARRQRSWFRRDPRVTWYVSDSRGPLRDLGLRAATSRARDLP